MKIQTMVTAVLTATISTTASAQSAADSVRALDSAWARSYQTHDTTLALAVFAEDIIVTATNGTTKNRTGEIADVRAQPGLKMDYFRTKNAQVRVHGRAAVVTGVAEWRFEFNGRASEMRRSYTSTFVPGGPLGWRMVALHIGRAPDP